MTRTDPATAHNPLDPLEALEVEVRGLTVDFPSRGIRALDDVDLSVEAGAQVALLGPSGSGKTTLLRALLGAVPTSGGTARVGGTAVTDGPAAVRSLRRRTGVIRQGDDLVLGISGRTNAVLGTAPTWSMADWLRIARGRAPRAWEDRLADLAERHGITACLPARASQLSGGQRQRVALVRALLPGPGLLLADEPTAGLDPATAATAVDALLATRVTLLVATHDLAVARRFPRVVALRDGRLVHDGAAMTAQAHREVYGADALDTPAQRDRPSTDLQHLAPDSRPPHDPADRTRP